MRFMCDGLIQYNGEHYIIEIKTESTHKFNRHQEPWPSHKLQATCYAMTIGCLKSYSYMKTEIIALKRIFSRGYKTNGGKG